MRAFVAGVEGSGVYQQIYFFMNRNFPALGILVLAVMFILAALSAKFRENRWIRLLYGAAAVSYMFGLLFLTLGSRKQYAVPILDMKLHFLRLEEIRKRDAWVLQGDVGNVILFFPFGIISQRFLGDKIHWFGCMAFGGVVSACIEALQYVFRRGYCDINDFLYNVSGVLAGYLAGRLAEWAFGVKSEHGR